MHTGVLGHTIVHLKLSGPLRRLCLGFPSSSHMSFCAGTQAATSILSPSSLVQRKRRLKCREKECFPLWMNCFTISYLLGSGNVRSVDFSLHRNSGWRALGKICSTPHSPLCLFSFSLENTALSASPPSFLDSHSTWAQSPPGELQLLASTKGLPCCLRHHLQPSLKVPGDAGKKWEAS